MEFLKALLENEHLSFVVFGGFVLFRIISNSKFSKLGRVKGPEKWVYVLLLGSSSFYVYSYISQTKIHQSGPILNIALMLAVSTGMGVVLGFSLRVKCVILHIVKISCAFVLKKVITPFKLKRYPVSLGRFYMVRTGLNTEILAHISDHAHETKTEKEHFLIRELLIRNKSHHGVSYQTYINYNCLLTLFHKYRDSIDEIEMRGDLFARPERKLYIEEILSLNYARFHDVICSDANESNNYHEIDGEDIANARRVFYNKHFRSNGD